MKPILKIEMPKEANEDDLRGMSESLKGAEVAKEYHVIVVKGQSDYISFEIITASDIGLHKV